MEAENLEPARWAPRFFTIWVGQAVSLFGSRLVQFALVWYLTDQTGSARVLTTATLIAMLPIVVLGPIVGTVVDRWNRRWTMVISDGLIALAALWLAFLFLRGGVTIWTVYSFILVRALGDAFHYPAMSASTPLLAPRAQLARIQGWNQMLNGALSIIAAPLGAFLLSVMSTQGILFLDVGTAILGIVPLLFLQIPQPRQQNGAGQRTTFSQDFKAGFAFVMRWPGLMILIGMVMVINFLFAPAGSLLPLLIKDHFGGSAQELGWIQSAFGFGMIGGGLFLGVWGGFKKRIYTSLMGLALLGIAQGVFGLIPGHLFWLALVFMFLVTFIVPIVNGPILAIIQSVVDPAMQGRVGTLISSLATAMSPLGLLVAGPFAESFGIQAWYVLAGVTCSLIGLLGFAIPAVVRIEQGYPVQEPEILTASND